MGRSERKRGISKYSGYGSWKAMRERCLNQNSKDYPYYGGRGVTICKRWSDSVNFAKDMGDKPFGCSLERIDNSKGYYPENCRWATPKEQGRNKRNNHCLNIAGVTKTVSQVWQEAEMKESTFYNRLLQGMSPEEALAKPVRVRIPHVFLHGEKMMLKEAAQRTGISKYILRKKVQPDLTIDLEK